MHRREFLVALAASAVLALDGCSTTATAGPARTRPARATPTSTPVSPRAVPSASSGPVPVLAKSPLPGGLIYELPGQGDSIAWTVDDGASSEVVGAYAQFARDSGVRLTFFLNGMYSSWTDNAPALRPLVDSGQVQLGNHTWSHQDLTSLSAAGIQEQLGKNGDFIKSTYGVEAAPFYRPPYGYTDQRSRAVASAMGYTAPTMWYGSLADSGLLPPQQIVANAQQWFQPQRIIIGHANLTPVTQVYAQLLDILHQRGLRTVTLRDVFQV